MLTGRFPDPATLRLPRGGIASFPLVLAELNNGGARAGIRKDAGDDPDVTHGALVVVELSPATPGSGIVFAAGEGVGTVSRPGLLLEVGEPAINPAPRAMIRGTLLDIAEAHGAAPPDVTVTISIPGGEGLAERTMNARLGIIGGLSILGTSGIVIPYSCASWIHSIHRGIDVARAAGLGHVGAALKYLRRHPVARVTIAGGFAKVTKLAGGHLDLHSSKGGVDIPALAALLAELGADPRSLDAVGTARSAAEILSAAGDKREALACRIAARAREVALATLSGETAVEVAITDREGEFVARVGGWQPSEF
jgi:cobalt-precorrin-5B (C1)-methyltransferase